MVADWRGRSWCLINIYVTGFLHRKKDETLIMCVCLRGPVLVSEVLLEGCDAFQDFWTQGVYGVIVHVWPERQVTVWLAADLMAITRRRRKPNYLCLLYFDDSTVIKITGNFSL